MGMTLFDKIWEDHIVDQNDDGSVLLYIDRHLVHEVTSPQAFEGLYLKNRKLWRPDTVIATTDHNIPTTGIENGIADPISREQVEALDRNCKNFGLIQFPIGDIRQGIIHVIAPEQGVVLPGMTVVCGDSHTSTHGAFGAIAMGIGTSEVEHVMATQCLIQKKPKVMRIKIDGELDPAVTGKDIALYVIGQIGTAGGTGYAIEFAGTTISALSMEGRMTLCNMAIEAGARCGIICVDQKTIDYLKDRPFAPVDEQWDTAIKVWKELCSDEDSKFDKELFFEAKLIEPQVTWGTSPEMVLPVTGSIPSLKDAKDATQREGWARALEYMELKENTAMTDIKVDKVFIGACTNARIEDFRAAAQIIRGKKISPHIKLALAVPGSGLVKEQAEREGLDKIFLDAGFEWRHPGCSMCLAMNDDRLLPGERCAATSNRNFENRQGLGGRTHLVSPTTAAATAITGHFSDIRDWS